MHSLGSLDSITGALLAGTWASSLLYTAEVLQAEYYFRHFKEEEWKLRTLVAIALSVDTASFLGNWICVYLYTVTHAGDAVYLSQQNFGSPISVIATRAVAVLVQGFLIHRYWRFTGNSIFALFMLLLCLASLGAALVDGSTLALFPSLKDRHKVFASGTLWIITQVSADLLIAAALISQLRKIKSTFSETSIPRVTSSLDQIIMLTFQTGAATAALSTAALIAYFLSPDTNLCVGILYNVGCVYMLSLLLNLNIRSSSKKGCSSCATSLGKCVAHLNLLHMGTGTDAEALGGVNVHRVVRL